MKIVASILAAAAVLLIGFGITKVIIDYTEKPDYTTQLHH